MTQYIPCVSLHTHVEYPLASLHRRLRDFDDYSDKIFHDYRVVVGEEGYEVKESHYSSIEDMRV